MSDTVLSHGYIPEEHAPDPVVSHGDPAPPGKIAIWLFLASEIMFFIGILGSYIVLRSGSPELFSSHAEATLSKPLAGLNTLVLIFSSLTMALSVDAAQKARRGRLIACLGLTLLMALGFMVIKTIEYTAKFTHYTIVATADDGQTYVYDGHVTRKGDTWHLEHAVRESIPAAFDIHRYAPPPHATETHTIDASKINRSIWYGPQKNIFYSCYFTLTGVHGAHVVGGMIPMVILLIQALRGRIFPATTEYIGLYWHFVDLVWIFLFPLLYLI